MKYLIFLVLVNIFLLTGCRKSQQIESNLIGDSCDSKLIDKEFLPKDIAGYWKANNSHRGFVISRKGELLQISNDGGLRIDVQEGGTRQEGKTENSMLYLILGPTNVEYDYDNHILEISIIYDEFVIEVPGGSVSGSMKEVFQGPVDLKTGKWYATLTSSGAFAGLQEDTATQKFVFIKMD